MIEKFCVNSHEQFQIVEVPMSVHAHKLDDLFASACVSVPSRVCVGACTSAHDIAEGT